MSKLSKSPVLKILSIVTLLTFSLNNFVYPINSQVAENLSTTSRIKPLCTIERGIDGSMEIDFLEKVKSSEMAPQIAERVLTDTIAGALQAEYKLEADQVVNIISQNLRSFIAAGAFDAFEWTKIIKYQNKFYLRGNGLGQKGQDIILVFNLIDEDATNKQKERALDVKGSLVEIISYDIKALADKEILALKEKGVVSDKDLEDSQNPAKMKGDVQHRENEGDDFVSVNGVIRQAFEAEKVEQIDREEIQRRVEGILLEKKEQILKAGLGEDLINGIISLIRSEDKINFFLVDNPSLDNCPAIVINDPERAPGADNYQVAHVGLSKKAAYFSNALIQSLKKNNENLANVIFAREAALLYVMQRMADSDSFDYDDAVIKGEKIAEMLEKALAGEVLDQVIQEEVDLFIDKHYEKLSKKNVVWDHETFFLPGSKGKPLEGGKSHELSRVWSRDTKNKFRSCSGTGTGCMKFLSENEGLLDGIYKIMSDLDTSEEKDRMEAYEQIKERVLNAEIPEAVVNDIKEAYYELGFAAGFKTREEIDTKFAVAIRSSGRAEDIQINVPELADISLGANAGQHDSYLTVIGADEVVWRWKCCIASLFTDRVLDYRDGIMVLRSFEKLIQNDKMQGIIDRLKQQEDSNDLLVAKALEEKDIKIISSMKLIRALTKNKFYEEAGWVETARNEFINIEGIAMGVTIMPMADAQLSYVNFGAELNTGWTGVTFQEIPSEEYFNKGRVYTISLNYGIGESIVQGATTPDTYTVHIFTGEDGREHINIIGRELGAKPVKAENIAPILKEIGIERNEVLELVDILSDFQEKKEVSITKYFKEHFDEKKPLSKNLVDKLFNAGANAAIAADVINNLIMVKVDKTDEVEISEAVMSMFRLERKDLDKIAHVIKELIKDRESATYFTNVEKIDRDYFAATESQVKMIARDCVRMAEGYGHAVDMEGAVGMNFGQDNKSIVLQRRPSNDEIDADRPSVIEISYTYVKNKDVKQIQQKKESITDILDKGDILCNGIATRNAFSGEIYKIPDNVTDRELNGHFEAIKRLADEGKKIIIRTTETTPDYVPVLKYNNVMGVIADVGGATSHAAVVSRELGIATVVGIDKWIKDMEQDPTKSKEKVDAIKRFLNTSGSIVTVDANQNETTGYGTVYAGELPLTPMEIKIDLDRLPDIYTKIAYIMGMPHPMLAMSKLAQYDGYYGVALMRAEFVYGEENINPRAGVAYDNLLVKNYLKTLPDTDEAKEYRLALSMPEKIALDKFKLMLMRRNSFRKRGILVENNSIENVIDEYRDLKNGAERFKASLSEYAREDMDNIQKYPEEIEKLVLQINGYLSYDEFFNFIHGGAVASMAAGNNVNKNTILYRSIDFKKNESRKLIGSVVFDPEEEAATMIGVRGARWLLQKQNQIILRKEVRLLLQQIDAGYRNIGFMFPFVATPDELKELLSILNEEERAMSKSLGRAVYLKKVGQMIELPSNVVYADEFARILSRWQKDSNKWFETKFGSKIKRGIYFSFGTNDLTQTTLGADRDQAEMGDLFDESHPFVIESIRHVVNTVLEHNEKMELAGTSENKIECGLCGQAIVNLVKKNPAAAEEILLMLGSTGGYAGTDYLGTELAIIRSACATMKHGVLKQVPLQEDVLYEGFTLSSDKEVIEKGAAARRLYTIEKAEDLIEKTYIGDFVLADIRKITLGNEGFNFADDDFNRVFEKLGAFIYYGAAGEPDKEESLIKHLNKLRVPVIRVSEQNVNELIKVADGEFITVDFNNSVISKGKSKIDIVVKKTPSKLKIVKEALDPQEIGFNLTFSAGGFYKSGYGLNKVHPLNFMAEDNKVQNQRITERGRIEIQSAMDQTGTETPKDALKEALKSYIKYGVAEAFKKELQRNGLKEKSQADLFSQFKKNNTLLYETCDLESDDFITFKCRFPFVVKKEINPPLGLAGLYAIVQDSAFKELFSVEMQAIKELIDEGYNMAIQFNSVKDPKHLKKAVQIISDLGIDSSVTKLGMNTAWPGNYLFTEEFIKDGQLSFISIEKEKLAQALLAAHMGGKNLEISSDIYRMDKLEKSGILNVPLSMIKNAVNENNIMLKGSLDAVNPEAGNNVPVDQIFESVDNKFAKEIDFATMEIPVDEITEDPSALILFADDILKKGVISDIAETLQNSEFKNRKILTNGHIILYVTSSKKDDEDIKALSRVITSADKTITVSIVDANDLGRKNGFKSEYEEMKELKDFAGNQLRRATKLNPADKQLLGILRGHIQDIHATEKITSDLKLPVIVFGGVKEGIYSFAQALREAIRLRYAVDPAYWHKVLLPIRAFDVEKLKDEYFMRVRQILIKA